METRNGFRIARVALTWLIPLAAFYVITADQPSLEENIAAVVTAVFATIVVITAAVNWGGGVRLPLSDVIKLYRPIAQVPGAVATVSARIIAAVLTGRILRGRKGRSPYAYGEQDDPLDVGRRAVLSYDVSLAPTSVLVAFIPESDEVVIHRLS